MWCKECRQDVPALPTGETRTFCCPRCGEILSSEDTPMNCPQTAGTTATSAENISAGDDAVPAYDSWELDQQLRDLEYVLKSVRHEDSQKSSPACLQKTRIDQPHDIPLAGHYADSKPKQKSIHVENHEKKPLLSALGWAAIALGTGSFVCGGILLGWAVLSGRQELWNLGLPTTIFGQVALLVGMLFQIERLWHGHRQAAGKLEHVDRQLHELKNTTTLLGVSSGPLSTTFYSHFVSGASPHLLLTDLKAQLDLLAMKLAGDDS